MSICISKSSDERRPEFIIFKFWKRSRICFISSCSKTTKVVCYLLIGETDADLASRLRYLMFSINGISEIFENVSISLVQVEG